MTDNGEGAGRGGGRRPIASQKLSHFQEVQLLLSGGVEENLSHFQEDQMLLSGGVEENQGSKTSQNHVQHQEVQMLLVGA